VLTFPLKFIILLYAQFGCQHYSRKLGRVCRATLCDKAFLSLNPLAFTRALPDVTASKLIARIRCLEIQFGIFC
jgi:hypothetical protein